MTSAQTGEVVEYGLGSSTGKLIVANKVHLSLRSAILENNLVPTEHWPVQLNNEQ